MKSVKVRLLSICTLFSSFIISAFTWSAIGCMLCNLKFSITQMKRLSVLSISLLILRNCTYNNGFPFKFGFRFGSSIALPVALSQWHGLILYSAGR